MSDCICAYWPRAEKLEAENARLREALGLIAVSERTAGEVWIDWAERIQAIARNALKETERNARKGNS